MESLNYLEKFFPEKGLADTTVIKLFHTQQLAFRAELSGNKIDEKIFEEV